MKKSRASFVVALILVFTIWMGYLAATTISVTSASQKKGDGVTDAAGIKLGLDLSGGVSITYHIKDENPSQTDIDDTIAKLEQRIESDNTIATTEYSVYQIGDDRIAVEIPGVYDANAVFEKLGNPGTLYFITQTDADGNANYIYDASITAEHPDWSPYALTSDIETLIANGSVILSGEDVKAASAVYQTNSTLGTSEPIVELQFNDTAAAIFGEATTAALAKGQTIGIYYDGHFISVPRVSAAITDGNCIINGMSDYNDANTLATFIRVGAMKLELEELESTVVGAQLGGQALSTSVKAAIIGLILVMIFMIIMYGISGVVASVALALYTALVVNFIYWFEVTLTLPGIAGVILGIGMAVDANVIIYSRIREEIASGKTIAVAITDGFKKSASAILDGQITTFIAAVVLMFLGSGTVKGFAYTLMISILLSLFTALVVSRFLMKSFFALGLKAEKLYGRAKERNPIDFMKHRVIYFIVSLVIIAAGFVGMGVNAGAGNRSLNFSLEFVGGTSTTVDMGTAYSIDQLEKEVVPVVAGIIGDNAIQANTVDGTNQVVLKTRSLALEEREAVENALAEQFNATLVESQNISSTISNEMRADAILAVIVACICMLLYIWVRFKDIRFATSAIMALVHDVLVVLTAYALIRISVGNTFIACMLTIVGYSVNDTIVIFDRIRENLHSITTQTPENLAAVANKSLTQTLSRSINTSITTFIMVLFLYVLGVASIREFALPLMVGLICGSYSSIFIATELWYIMKLHLGKGRLIKK